MKMKFQLTNMSDSRKLADIGDKTVALLRGCEVEFESNEAFILYIAHLQDAAIAIMREAIAQGQKADFDIGSFNFTFREHIEAQIKLTDGPRVIEQFVKAYSEITGKSDSAIMRELDSVAAKALADQRMQQIIALVHFGLADLDELVAKFVEEELACSST